jgi:transposase
MSTLVSMSDIAKELGVRRATVWAWDQRRERNGFPQHVKMSDERRPRKLYDHEAVMKWHTEYTPSKGGAPIGNKNWRGTKE